MFTGLAPDGGLFVPDRIPKIPDTLWASSSSFPNLAANLLTLWLKEEIPAGVLSALAKDAFQFPIRLVPLNGPEDAWNDLYVLELFHGPTHSFKDFGARTMARLMAYFQQDAEQEITVLVATSGDTGSAVADGFARLPGIQVVLLYPDGQVSPIQERQLVVRRPGVQAFAVDGSFDDCQRMVKAAFSDPNLADVRLTSANSINIGRLIPQSMYYVWALAEQGGVSVTFCTPSGNLGNLTGGLWAADGGLPVHRFIAAHNANDFFPRFLKDPTMAFQPSVRTISNAMDVGAPSNFERLAVLFDYDATDMNRRIWAASVSDEETRTAMARVYDETGYVADPHTAVGLQAVRRYRAETGDSHPVVVLGTAHPAKFPEVIQDVLGVAPPDAPGLPAQHPTETSVHALDARPEALRDVLLNRT